MIQKTDVGNESFYQWIWSSLQFDVRNLHSRAGHQITILKEGTLNRSDGPDFSNALLHIDGLYWYGDIELHIHEQDWFNHGHQADAGYDRVILHVVLFEDSKYTVKRSDGTTPFTLNLRSYLKSNLARLLYNFKAPSRLPCDGIPSQLHPEAFKKQLNKAHLEYFFKKIDDLDLWFNQDLPFEEAWKRMLILAFFDGLGIPHNRSSMIRLGKKLLDDGDSRRTHKDFHKYALKKAGFKDDRLESTKYNWKYKGSRPHNHPDVRIKQAVQLLLGIRTIPIEKFQSRSPDTIWRLIQEKCGKSANIGPHRSNILFSLSLLPALYKLGFHCDNNVLKRRSVSAWNQVRVKIPGQYIRRMKNSKLKSSSFDHLLGTVHQFRTYCDQKRCQECEVFKYVFYS